MAAALCDYSLSIARAVPSRRMALQEFSWRNGFFLQQAGATPLHRQWLRRAGVDVEVVGAQGGGAGAAGGSCLVATDRLSGAQLLRVERDGV